MHRVLLTGLIGLSLATAGAAQAASWGRLDFSTEYVAQWADQGGDDARDQDISTTLGTEFDQLGLAGLSFSGLFWYGKDLDGTNSASFARDNLDSFSRRDDLRVYRAALSYRTSGGGLQLTGGRLEMWSADPVAFDGGSLRVEPCRWAWVELFGGKRVSHYEADVEPDPVYGGNLGLGLWQGALLRVEDVFYIENTLEATLTQRLGDLGSAVLDYRMIADDPQQAGLALHLYPWVEAELHASYRQRFVAWTRDSDDFAYDYTADPEYPASNLRFERFSPYYDVALEARQGVLGRFGIGARYRLRGLFEDEDETRYNVGFQEAALLADVTNWPWSGLRVDAEVNRWVEDREDDRFAEDSLWGFLVRGEQEFRGHAVGGGYHRQSYDTAGLPRDTRGFEAWLRLRLCPVADLYLRYEREEDDLYADDDIDAISRATARLDVTY